MAEAWPPGFRFHPTDEELVLYYLKRKICRRRIKIDAIAEVDVLKCDPEDLPGLSMLKTGDRQWFFFSPKDRKYPNGSKSNRTTEHGYWKLTGKDRAISCSSRVVGSKKTLIFYEGRAPKGERTDWVMHEYALNESELMRCQNVQDNYALCKVFKKSGAGPKNGEQYGAPFKEEDWSDDELPQVSIQNGADNHAESVQNGADNHAEQSKGVASVDIPKDKPQEECAWDDIEEFMKRFVDDPAPERPAINDYECLIPQVFGEEAPNTMTELSFGQAECVDPWKMHPPYSEHNMFGSMNYISAASQVQIHDACGVAYTGPNELEQHPLEEDFLEMDDLLAPETTDGVCEYIPQSAGGALTTNSQWGEVDGLSELDLLYEAEMFISEPSLISQATASHSNPNFENASLVNWGTQQGTYDQNCFYLTMDVPLLESKPLSSPTTGDVYAGNFTPNAMESHTNRSGKGVEGNDKWYTSSLWSFVESIPTTPASAADSALVNWAFVRMPSFTRLSTTTVVGKTTSGSTGGRMMGFFLLPYMGVLFAFLFVLIGTFGKIMSPLQHVQ